MSLSPSLPPRCWSEIDLGALERNVRRIRAALPDGVSYVAVVKADAYGHGLAPVASRLMHAGVDLFGVANLSEAAALREIGPGWPVLLLSPLLPEEDRHLPDLDVAATLSGDDELERLARVASRTGRALPVHVKIDTGMGRVGIWHEQAPEFIARVAASPAVRLEGVFTHFSNPDGDPAFTAHQRRLFTRALDRVAGLDRRRLLIHADNSAGVETFEAGGPFNAVRVGLLQFGIRPGPASFLAGVVPEPVFTFRTRVGLVKHLPEGTGISYGRTHVLTRPSTIAVLTAGYGDGVARALSGRGAVLLKGRRCPILGRVTMDQTIVDVTDVPGVVPGDEAVLVGFQDGAEIPLVEFSRWADTIPWETLCSVTKRVPRLYRTLLGS